MSLVPTSGPVLEPVSLGEAKAHLRVDHGAEDLLIASLITAARVHIELVLSRALITQSWSWFLDAWPDRVTLELPIAPVRAINAVRILTQGDAVATLGDVAYALDGQGLPPRLARKSDGRSARWKQAGPQPAYAANGIEIDFVAGYGDAAADVPQPLRQAVLLLVAHWYERREPVEIGRDTSTGHSIMPAMVEQLIAPYRAVRL